MKVILFGATSMAGQGVLRECLLTSKARGYDPSAGMSEEDYTRVTYGIAMAAAKILLEESPGATFVFVSGAGTDSTEKSTAMWARVKGKTENALLAMPFKAVYVFRPPSSNPSTASARRPPSTTPPTS